MTEKDGEANKEDGCKDTNDLLIAYRKAYAIHIVASEAYQKAVNEKFEALRKSGDALSVCAAYKKEAEAAKRHVETGSIANRLQSEIKKSCNC